MEFATKMFGILIISSFFLKFLNSSNKNLITLSSTSSSILINKENCLEINEKSLLNLIKSSIKGNQILDSERIMAIHNTLDGIYERLTDSNSHGIFPIEISKMIGIYEHSNKPLMDVYEKVIKKLNLSMKELEVLDFNSSNFANQLVSIISSRKLEILPFNFFWYDLSSLLFKWMIFMKQEIANIDGDGNGDKDKNVKNEKFKEISKSLRLIDFTISSIGYFHIPDGFDLDSIKCSLENFKNLTRSEMFENPIIFQIFAFAIRDFYLFPFSPSSPFNNHSHSSERDRKKRKITRNICNELKIKYFNGDYNKNILLKYLMIMYDPEMKLRNCILEDDEDNSNFLKDSSRSIEITLDYIEELKFKGPKELEITNVNYASQSIINFFLSIGKRFPIADEYDLFNLLKRLKEANLMKREIVERIVGFKAYSVATGEFLEWNQNKFKHYIHEYSSYNHCEIESNEYLKLFDKNIQ